MLIGAWRRAAGLGITLRLAARSPPVAALLRVTGLDRALIVQPPRQVRAELAA
ncbi:hypothetical protein [Actinomadura formosensis]|uniref:hypothetical protein n=1 Tax=Actinomadura formosensis TaxID=60706 RepID=UPI0012F87BF7|nr:hypothetical protein [Actinomadura formosensis]